VKTRIAVEMAEAVDARVRSEVLVAALYELSRTVLPALGPPLKTREYQEGQAAVLELISFIAIPLIRGSTLDTRGIAVLTEVGEGCQDPLLKKKLSVYAQQLLALSSPGPPSGSPGRRRWLPWLIGATAAGTVGLSLAVSLAPQGGSNNEQDATALRSVATPSAVQPAATLPGSATPSAVSAEAPSALREPLVSAPVAPTTTVREGSDSVPQGEQATKVRIINNQVLVPVLLKSGGDSVRAEMVLDTGATRTAIHDGVANRLRIDLRQAKQSVAEVADGRLMRSVSTTLDSVTVGPFTMTAAELDIIPYRGNQGVHDGLLGMDFLSRHRYQIDMEHEQIRWF